MPIKTPTLKPAKKMVVHTVSTPLPYAHYQRCTQCDMLFRLPVLKRNQSARCPRCNAKVRDGRDWSLTRTGSMALAMLLLMPFAGRSLCCACICWAYASTPTSCRGSGR